MIKFWKILTPVSIKYIQSNGARALCSPWPWLSNISMYYHSYGTALRKHRKYENSGVTNKVKKKHCITRFQSHSLVSLLREAITSQRPRPSDGSTCNRYAAQTATRTSRTRRSSMRSRTILPYGCHAAREAMTRGRRGT